MQKLLLVKLVGGSVDCVWCTGTTGVTGNVTLQEKYVTEVRAEGLF